jgi:hypothetical protein
VALIEFDAANGTPVAFFPGTVAQAVSALQTSSAVAANAGSTAQSSQVQKTARALAGVHALRRARGRQSRRIFWD